MDEWGIDEVELVIQAPAKILEMELNSCRAQYHTLQVAKFKCSIE